MLNSLGWDLILLKSMKSTIIYHPYLVLLLVTLIARNVNARIIPNEANTQTTTRAPELTNIFSSTTVVESRGGRPPKMNIQLNENQQIDSN